MTSRILGAALAAALLASPVSSFAQQDGAEADPVVARVDGEPIHRSDVLEMASTLPPQYQAQPDQIFPLLIERLIDFTLVGKAGRSAGLADDDEVKARVASAEEQAVREVYLTRAVEAELTAASLQARYKTFLEQNPPKTEHKASHILLETEEKAKEMIALLDGGADFAELAKEHSTGPSAPKGGDLGYFTSDQMVSDFSATAEALQPGEFSKAPTQTQFGWHVIKVEDRRIAEPPPFEQVEQALREDMSRETIQKIFADLRQNATVELVNPEAEGAAPEAEKKAE
ncbi:MAG: peptidylprolyl isomerase [Kiloniellales bacterium]